MKKILLPFTQLDMKRKMICIFFFLFLCILILVWIITVSISLNYFKDDVKQIGQKNVDQASVVIESSIERMERCANTIFSNKDVLSIFEKYSKVEGIYTNITDQYYDYCILIDFFKEISSEYQFEASCYLNSSFDYVKDREYIFDIETINLGEKEDYNTITIKLGKSEKGENCVSYIKPIKSQNDYTKIIGLVRVDVLQSDFLKILDNINIYNGSLSFISDTEKILLSTSILESKENSYAEYKEEIEKQNYYLFSKKLVKNELYISTAIPKSTAFKLALKIVVPISIFVVLCIILAYKFIGIISGSMTARINEIIAHIKNVDANFKNEIPNPIPNDDIGLLISAYNKMNSDLSRMIEKQIEDETLFTLRILQEQITPHFLYNSLTTIMCLIKEGKKDNAISAMKMLADFYRHNCLSVDKVVSLKSEIEMVVSYIELQKICLKDDIEYNIDMEMGMFNYTIPKMSVQPIVENAIRHGILPCKEKKQKNILIAGYTDNRFMYIMVTDNGIGMRKEKIEEINDNIMNYKIEKSGVGLENIDRRIKLQYGQDCGLFFESVEGEYTTVTMKLRIR